MSAGEFFDLIRPAVLVLSAIVSALVLASARKRFPFYQSLLWAIGTLFLPLIVIPIYFVLLLKLQPRSEQTRSIPKRRFFVPFAYAAIVLSSIAIYLLMDNQGVDAHLARATQARVRNDRAATIREYRQALALEENAHTHKLLAIELADSDDLTEAISEFRLAEQGGEPDDSIHFRLGQLLERMNLQGQAGLEYQVFLNSNACTGRQLDYRCNYAREIVARAEKAGNL